MYCIKVLTFTGKYNNMEIETKQEIIYDLANNVSQSDIVAKHDNAISQQSISYLKKQNSIEIEKLRAKLLDKLAKRFVSRAIRESDKAEVIINHYDDKTLNIPNKDEASYLQRLDSKTVSLIKGIVAPHTNDTNIAVTKNEVTTNIVPNVLKMFQAGAMALHNVIETESQ